MYAMRSALPLRPHLVELQGEWIRMRGELHVEARVSRRCTSGRLGSHGVGSYLLESALTLPLAYLVTSVICTREQFTELVPMTPRTAMLALAYSILAIGLAISSTVTAV